ncbi:hypothetical protein K8R66_02315 [bacterium]|nr:hypothetical protein [bacterium]
MFKKFKILSLIGILLINFIPSLDLQAQEYDPDFDQNYIISQFQMFDYDAMSQAEIQSFLVSKGSYLVDYYTDGWPIHCDIRTGSDDSNCQIMTRMRASEIIYSAAQRYKVSPRLILVMLQKEQGLIQWEGTPPAKRLDWACGYAVCDNCSMDDPKIQKYKGFGRQVDNVAGAMRFYQDYAHTYSYIKTASKAYNIDGETVIPSNQSTANLYTYTPHTRGPYTFWRVWQRYFGDPTSSQRDKTSTISTDYMLQIIGSSIEKLMVYEGEKTGVWVEYLNIGTKVWDNETQNKLYLIDAKYKSQIPIISKTSNFSLEESMKKDVVVYSAKKTVLPGKVLRLSFLLGADYEKYKSGEYILVLDGKGWFADSGIAYNLERIFRYDAKLNKGIPKNLEAGETNTITVEYKNVGTKPWYQGETYLKWISSGHEHYAKMNQWHILPGEIASFTFYSKVDGVGDHQYDLSVWKKVDAGKYNKFPTGENKFVANMSVRYAAKILYESIPREIVANQEKNVILRVRNIGSETWNENLVLRSYSNIKPFSSSYFDSSEWISSMAIQKVNKEVKPGNVYVFKFKVKAPSRAYTYDQYYQLEWGPNYKEIYIGKDLSKHYQTKVIN